MVIEIQRRRQMNTEIFSKKNPFKRRATKKIFVEDDYLEKVII